MDSIYLGSTKDGRLEFLNLAMANRHGLIAGATGTGKTVTLQTLAEQFSRNGVCVFTADVKGDLSGFAKPGLDNPKIKERLANLKMDAPIGKSCPILSWDIYGEHGHPLRATITEIGPLYSWIAIRW